MVAEAGGRPGDGPFDGAGVAGALDATGEGRGDGFLLADALGQVVGQA